LDVPEPVMALAVNPAEKALNLSWVAPARTLTGQSADSIAGYNVYRSEAGPGNPRKPGPYALIAEAHDTSYSDSNFEFGHFYAYKVRAVVRQDGQSAESADSGTVEIMPRDTFPPAAPAALTGLYTAGVIEIIWSPNLEPDLAGYNIYRREENGQEERLNRELLPTSLYRDAAVSAGHRYSYRVTAVDRNGNESSPSSETEVEAQ
ncbi:MAG TPA: hypothetical protein VJX67_02290, partial [Blastocatellia bacterium]|nr:hypothetical protein [Blastocatellia bacterium]